MTKNFKDMFPTNVIQAEYFAKKAIQSILDQSGCVGVRIYYGLTDLAIPALVIVGVNSLGQDMTDGPMAELGYGCPPWCDTTRALTH